MSILSNFLASISKSNLPLKPIRVLGIDLGTTNSAAAEIVWDPKNPENAEVRCLDVDQMTLEGRHTHQLVPSVLALYNDQTFIGEGAKRLRARSADYKLKQNQNIFFECKNDMGIAKTYHQAPEGFRSAAEVGSKILQFIAGASIATSDLPLERVVVTVPASFQAPQREDTFNAALQAQLNLQNGDLLDEPVAAFIDFICSYPKKFSINPGESKHVLVFDFGGGTCDVAVLKLTLPITGEGLQIDMRSVSRYHRLGGGDIDRAIVYEILIPQLMSQNGLDKYDLSYEDKKNFLEPALIGFAEALKIKISNEVDRLMRFNKYHDSDKSQIITKLPQTSIFNVGTKQYVYKSPQLTAAEFEKVLEPFMDRDLLYTKEDDYRLTCSIFAPLEDGIERSNVAINDIDYCLLVGGSSLIPQIRSAVTDYLKSAKLLSFDSYEQLQLTVARGAAYHALILNLTGKPFVQPVCHDRILIKTKSGGIELVPKGVTIPYPAEDEYAEIPGLVIPQDDSSKILIEIIADSEERTLFREVWEIKRSVKKGEPIIMKCRFDGNQVLHLQLHTKNRMGPTDLIVAQVERPFTHVVNPQKNRQRIHELEEELRVNRELPLKTKIKKMVELSDEYSKMGQMEKAIAFLKRALKAKQSSDAWILNKLGLAYSEISDYVREEKVLREAASVSSWSGPLFNLALSQRRQKKYDDAKKSIIEAFEREQLGPYLVLRAQLAKDCGDTVEFNRYLKEAMDIFEAPDLMDDWELHWYLTGARLLNDQEKVKIAQQEQKMRNLETGIGPKERGELPAEKSKEEG